MKKLVRIRLINWHRYWDTTLDVNGTLVIFGRNRVGKSTILDAIQLVIVGDGKKVRFNIAANTKGDASDRDIWSYVKGRVEYTKDSSTLSYRFLRPDGCTSYLMLEFEDEPTGEHFVLGVIMEVAGDNQKGEKKYFIANRTGISDLTVSAENGPLPIHVFKRNIKGDSNIKWCEQVSDYTDAVRQRLGRVGEDYPKLFVKSLSLKNIGNVRDFVVNTLLDQDAEIDILPLRETVDEYNRLREMVTDAKSRIALLNQILESAKGAREAEDAAFLAGFLVKRAAAASKQEQAAEKATVWKDAVERRQATETSHEWCKTKTEEARKFLREAQARLNEHQVYQEYKHLEEKLIGLKATIQRLRLSEDVIIAAKNQMRGFLEKISSSDYEDIPLECRPTEREGIQLERFAELAEGILAGASPENGDAEGICSSAYDALKSVYDRAHAKATSLKDQADSFLKDLRGLDLDLKNLQDGIRKFPSSTETLRRILRDKAGIHANVFCDLLEIRDESWRDAVEGFLGGKRFDLLVPPERYDEALSIYEREKRAHNITRVGLVNLKKMSAEGKTALPGSLAEVVEAKTEQAKIYLNFLIGNVIRCDDEQKLKKYFRSITRTVMIYSGHVARQKPFEDFEEKYIGRHGIELMKESIRRRIEKRNGEWVAVNNGSKTLKIFADLADTTRKAPEQIRERRNDLVEKARALRDMTSAQARFQMLNLQDVETLNRDLAQADVACREAQDSEKIAYGGMMDALSKEDGIQREYNFANAEARAAIGALNIDYPPDEDFRPRGEEAYSVLAAKEVSNDRIVQMNERRKKEMESLYQRHRESFISRATEFNVSYRVDSVDPSDPGSVGYYEKEWTRWLESELPRYQSDIEDARENALQLLQEDVVHRLREKFSETRRQFDSLNKALRNIVFSDCRYHFKCTPKTDPDFAAFYRMIESAHVHEDAPLYRTPWSSEHKLSITSLLEEILNDRSHEMSMLASKLDHRNYFEFDVEIRDQVTEEKSSLSRLMASGSGGEKITPFYVSMLASISRVCRVDEEKASTCALIAFDEAFDKVDEHNARGVMDLAQSRKLQLVLAAPAERMQLILSNVPGNYSCYLMYREKDQIFAEPFTKEMLEDDRYVGMLSEPGEEEEGEPAPV